MSLRANQNIWSNNLKQGDKLWINMIRNKLLWGIWKKNINISLHILMKQSSSM